MIKDKWQDKINGESVVDAGDINDIAHSVIDLENKTIYISNEINENKNRINSLGFSVVDGVLCCTYEGGE